MRDICDCITTGIFCQCRHILAIYIAESNLIVAVVLVGDYHRRTAYVLKTAVFQKQFVAIIRINVKYSRHILGIQVHHCQTGFLTTKCCYTLSLKIRINHHYRPSRRRFSGIDTIIASIESHIFHFITDIEQSGFALTYVYCNVTNKTMLCIMGTQRNSMRIAVFYPKINIGHRAIKCTGIGITGSCPFFYHSTGKPKHIFRFSLIRRGFFLKSRRILGKNKFRTFFPIPNQANGTGYIDSLTDFIFSFGNKKNTKVLFLLHLINRCLQGIRYIHLAICLYRIVLGGKIKCFGIIGFQRIDRVQLYRIKLPTKCYQ